MQPTYKIEEDEEYGMCSVTRKREKEKERRRRGEEKKRISSLFILYLTMEYTPYSLSSIL